MTSVSHIDPLDLPSTGRAVRRNRVLGYIRQLCVSGIDSHLIVPLLVEAVRLFVGGDWGGFCWPDERGYIAEVYAENCDLYAITPAYVEQYGGTHLEREAFGFDYPMAMRTGVGWRNLDLHRERLKRSEYFDCLFRPLGIRHGIEVTAREGGRGWGSLTLYREATAKTRGKPFRPEEERTLSELAPLLAHALRFPSAGTVTMANARESADVGMILSDEAGNVVLRNDSALPLLLQLHGGLREHRHIDLRKLPSGLMPLVQAVRQLARGTRALPPVYVSDTPWGRFRVRAYATREPGRSRGPLVALHVSRLEPLSVRVLRNAWLAGLSERQRLVCLHLAEGRSYPEIAALMNVRRNTVIDYVRKVYIKLSVSNREDLLRALSVS